MSLTVYISFAYFAIDVSKTNIFLFSNFVKKKIPEFLKAKTYKLFLILLAKFDLGGQ